MRNDASFKDYVLDQLVDVGEVNAKAMFGGYGLYNRGMFFGIVFKNRLYFKTDERTRHAYTEAGMKPFQPNTRQTLRNYYEVPADIIEDLDQLAGWAKTAIEVAR